MLRIAVRASVFAVLSVTCACSGTMDGNANGTKPGGGVSGNAAKGEAAVKERGCAGCHSSSLGTLAGAATGHGSAANLTPDQKTGLGAWKDEDIISAIRDGIDDEQNTLCSSMPRALAMPDVEAEDIVAYLRSVPAVLNEVTGAECTVSAKDAAHHGLKAVEAQHCKACHGSDLSGADGKRGPVFASNLTPDMGTGLGGWSVKQIGAAITEGTDDERKMLCSQMPRFTSLTSDEVNGIAEYLKTIPAKVNKVPASTCESEHSDPKKDGEAYVANRRCTECHQTNLGGKDTCLPSDPANLTPTNLGQWSDQQIINAMRLGTDDEGEMLPSEMPRFATMGDEEAAAIVAYLRSVSPVIRAGCALDGADAGMPSKPTPADGGIDGGPTPPRDAGHHGFDAGAHTPDAGAGGGGCSGSPVVISQIYGGGANVGAIYNADFVELHNRSARAVSLSGWSLQYASASGSSWKSQLSVLPSTARIVAGSYVLVALGPAGTTGVSLPSSALKPSKQIDLSATSGKIVLVRDSVALSGDCPSGSSIADLVGYGTANCAEGESAAAPLSSVLAANRSSASGSEMACADSQVNASDFFKATPAPHGSTINVCQCPSNR